MLTQTWTNEMTYLKADITNKNGKTVRRSISVIIIKGEKCVIKPLIHTVLNELIDAKFPIPKKPKRIKKT